MIRRVAFWALAVICFVAGVSATAVVAHLVI
jgi:hypothetical protein